MLGGFELGGACAARKRCDAHAIRCGAGVITQPKHIYLYIFVCGSSDHIHTTFLSIDLYATHIT